jgi:hypothetical protein
MRRYLTTLLIIANLGLGIGLGLLWVDDGGNLKNVHWAEPAPVKPEMPVWPVSLQTPLTDNNAFLNVLERPLFSPSRRPPPPPPPPVAPAPPDPLLDAQILGVFGSGDVGGVFALIQGRMRRLAKGEQVGEWLLKGVSDRDATFDRKGEVRVIRLTNARLNSSSGAPPVYRAALVQARPPETPPSPVATPSSAEAPVQSPPKIGGAVFGGGARPAAPVQR